MRHFLCVMCLTCMSSHAMGKDIDGLSLFVKQEVNDTDRISSVGIAQQFNFANSDLGGEAITNLTYAEVVSEAGYLEEFIGWEVGLRLGYFSKVFAYVEAGFDLGESILNDSRYDCCEDYYAQHDDPDGYAGLGMGFNVEYLRFEVSIRARQLDSEYWRSERQIFYGAQLSISF
jgi:hypothetical protein